jgi:hypothetical protein
LITKPFFRNHVILMFFSINGYTQSFYFPLMLMDIMNNSDVLANIARSVTDNLGALGWVFYLFICTVVIYAQVQITPARIELSSCTSRVHVCADSDFIFFFCDLSALILHFFSLGFSTLKTTSITTAWLTTRKQLAATLS